MAKVRYTAFRTVKPARCPVELMVGWVPVPKRNSMLMYV